MTRKNLRNLGYHRTDGLEATRRGKQQYKSGDITWTKIYDNSWWPAQVVDEKCVGNKPKKKAKDEILVRLYGTYDYLYVNPVKSSSDFENVLKEENITTREALQKALEKELSCMKMKSGRNSKRKVSEAKENCTGETPERKKQKQGRTENSEEAARSASPGYPSAKPKEVAPKQKVRKETRNQASKVQKSKQDEAGISEASGKATDKTSKDKIMNHEGAGLKEDARNENSKIQMTKQYCSRRSKRISSRVKEDVGDEVSKDKIADLGIARKQSVMEKLKSGASKVINIELDYTRQSKHDKGKEKVKQVGDEVLVDSCEEIVGAGNEYVIEKVKIGVSKILGVKQDGTRELKHNNIKAKVNEDDRDEAFKASSANNCGPGRQGYTEKLRSGASGINHTNRDGIRQPNAVEQVVEKVGHEDSKDKSMKEGGTGTPNAKRKMIVSKPKRNTKPYNLRIQKHKDVEEKVSAKIRGEASMDKCMEPGETGGPNVTKEATSGPSKAKTVKQYALRPKSKDGKGQVKEKKVTAAACEKEGNRLGRSGEKSDAAQKVINGACEVMTMMRNGVTQSEDKDAKEQSNAQSRSCTKCSTPEETAELSARRVRVMQSLGLIAPSGSPFRKNGLVKSPL